MSPQPAKAIGVRQIEKTSAAEVVREQLLALIESGDLSVGDKLPSEHSLAESFGVSRPIVREGLGALRAAGVVESRSGSGTFVTAKPTRNGLLLQGRYSAEDLFEVRCHLEIPGAALAAQRRTAPQLADLAAIVERHTRRTAARDWVQDDLEFHVLLAEATGNALQAHLVRELRELQQDQNVAIAEVTDLEAPLAEHRAIVRAVERRDPRAARTAMRAHLNAIRGRIRAASDAGAAA